MRASPYGILAAVALTLGTILTAMAGLLFWGAQRADTHVRDQLVQQQITMPSAATGLLSLPKGDQDALRPYAGTPLDDGAKAKAYADHFVTVRMDQLSQGRSVQQMNEEFSRRCTGDNASHAGTVECTRLQGMTQNLRQGNTLRGMLSAAHSFTIVGVLTRVAGWVVTLGAISALVAGLLAFSRPAGSNGRHAAH